MTAGKRNQNQSAISVVAAAKSGPSGPASSGPARTDIDPDHPLWPAPDHPRRCARRVVKITQREGTSLYHWHDEWYRWCGTHYEELSEKDIHDWLFGILENAKYEGASQNDLKWKPTTKKLRDLSDAMRGLVKLPNTFENGSWLNGNKKDNVIACEDGLLQIPERKLVPHTPEYFNVVPGGGESRPERDPAETPGRLSSASGQGRGASGVSPYLAISRISSPYFAQKHL